MASIRADKILRPHWARSASPPEPEPGSKSPALLVSPYHLHVYFNSNDKLLPILAVSIQISRSTGSTRTTEPRDTRKSNNIRSTATQMLGILAAYEQLRSLRDETSARMFSITFNIRNIELQRHGQYLQYRTSKLVDYRKYAQHLYYDDGQYYVEGTKSTW